MKFLSRFPMLVITGCQTLHLKRDKVVDHQTRSQIGECVAINIMVIAFLARTIALGVARVSTRLGLPKFEGVRKR